jgi:hypothetical protein
MIPLTEIFTMIDDYCKTFDQNTQGFLLPNPKRKRQRYCRISISEIMTIILMFQLSHYRTFKDFYLECILIYYRKEFPNYVSYNRFIELMPMAFMPLTWMMTSMFGLETGTYFIDSTKLPVCHNLRINRHKVFKDYAKRGKTSTGWFFGFKLHLVFNERGEIMRFCLTPGNVDDRAPVESMMKKLTGWLVGDRGYISQKLKETLEQQGVEIITKAKKNMKDKVLEPAKAFLLGKRGIVETIIDQLKNILHVDHTRHRSVMNFQVHVLAALVAYTFLPKKPSVRFNQLNNAKLALTSN